MHVIPMIITCMLQGTLCDTGIPRTFYGGNICSVYHKIQFGVPYRTISLVGIDLFIVHHHSAMTFHLTDFSRKSAAVTHKKIQSLKFFVGQVNLLSHLYLC